MFAIAGSDDEEDDDIAHQQRTAGDQETGCKSVEDAGAPGEGTAQDTSVWKGRQPALEASRDEEFDEYFTGMFP